MSTKKLDILVDEFNKLPGIGRKTAHRLAFYILEEDMSAVERFASALIEAKKSIKHCITCGNISENEKCEICDNESRDKTIICVVEDVKDIIALERAKSYKGLYHVLGGKISPLNGVNVDKLRIKELLERLKTEGVKEIILALNPDMEGETTSLYLSKLISPIGIKITKIASGIPIGGNIEFSDIATLVKSIEGRAKVGDS